MTPPFDATSPTLHPYQGTFSEEEIHDILGAMHDHPSNELDDDPELPGPSPEARAKARSERKRSREKQRREDVNKQFSDLSTLLRTIEEDEDEKRFSNSTSNRVDLIARTIVTLERVHKLSKDRQQEIANLQKQLEDAQKMAEDTAARLKEATLYQQPGPQKQVMMMVPMMVNPDSLGQGGGFMAPQPFMPQQMMMMPQMAAAPQPIQQQQAPPIQQPQQQRPPQQPQMQQQPHPSMQQQQLPQSQMHHPHQPMQQQHPQMQMVPQMMPQMMPQSFASMMFQQPVQTAPAAAAAAPSAASAPDGKEGSRTANGGGNLAHCA